MPPLRGEGMTRSHPRSAHHREPGPDERDDIHHQDQQGAPDKTFFSAAHSMRRTAPASRPYGRYAVGLRPSLDPDAILRRATAAIGEDRTSDQEPLDRPRSFRDDLRLACRGLFRSAEVDLLVSVGSWLAPGQKASPIRSAASRRSSSTERRNAANSAKRTYLGPARVSSDGFDESDRSQPAYQTVLKAIRGAVSDRGRGVRSRVSGRPRGTPRTTGDDSRCST